MQVVKLEDELDKVKDFLKDTQAVVAALKAEKQAAEVEESKLKLSVDELTQEKKSAQEKVEVLMADLATLRSTLTRKDQELEAARATSSQSTLSSSAIDAHDKEELNKKQKLLEVQEKQQEEARKRLDREKTSLEELAKELSQLRYWSFRLCRVGRVDVACVRTPRVAS